MSRSSVLSRREMNRLMAAGVLGASASGWLGALAARAAARPAPGAGGKACILIWMDGGPCHIDTFDPKPDARPEVRGGLSAIDTAVDGIQVGERFPKFAR